MRSGPHHYPKWIWHPGKSGEMTWVLFRREFNLSYGKIKTASGIVSADTRYNLYVNGILVRRGPAPFDPRFQELDPVDLKPHLKEGKNVIGALVCWFGRPDGTYVKGGRPAFLFGSGIVCGNNKIWIETDTSWKCLKSSAWQLAPPRNKHRALIEQFDARLFPYGWLEDGFDDSKWQNAVEHMAWLSAEKKMSPIPFGKPSCYGSDDMRASPRMKLTPRTIADMAEMKQPRPALICSGRVEWLVTPEEYFEYKDKNAFKEFPDDGPRERKGESVKVSVEKGVSTAFVYDLGEVMVGYPYFRVKAPAGAIFELIFAEVRDENALIGPSVERFGCWGRYVTRAGENLFECFDYEQTRYITILVRNTSGPAEILEVGFLRRVYGAFVKEPEFDCSDSMVSKIFGAAKNTLRNTLQDVIVDNVMREREQYCGDMGLGTLGAFYGFGDTLLAERRLRTFFDGQLPEGGLLACWPGSGQLNDLFNYWLMGMGSYGPEYICASGYVFFDAENLFMWSGRKQFVYDLWPKFLKFDAYISSYLCADGLLPVKGWELASVYIDCEGLERENDKRAAFNHAYLMYLNSMRNMALAIGENSSGFEKRIKNIITALRRKYWCRRRKLIVDNLSTEKKDKKTCLYDRTIAMALIYGVVPVGEEKNCLDVLERVPSSLGLSSPPLACWRLWALFRFGRGGAAVKDMTKRWGAMASVHHGNCISERWNMATSSLFTGGGEVIKPRLSSKTMASEAGGGVWCQNATAPLFLLMGDVLGVKPLEPGFKRFQIRPQPGSLQWIKGVVHTPTGDIRVSIQNENNIIKLDFESPPGLKPVIVTEMGRKVEGAGKMRFFADKRLNVLKWELPVKRNSRTWKLAII